MQRRPAREQLVVVIKVPHESRAVLDGEEVAGGARDEADTAKKHEDARLKAEEIMRDNARLKAEEDAATAAKAKAEDDARLKAKEDASVAEAVTKGMNGTEDSAPSADVLKALETGHRRADWTAMLRTIDSSSSSKLWTND